MHCTCSNFSVLQMRRMQCRVMEHAARAAAVQATACAAASHAAHAELASMHSAAQSEATALNEAKIAYLTT